jgi:hypothetical protein
LSASSGTVREHVFDDAENYQGGYDAAIGHFVDCLASGLPFETHPGDNLQTLRLVESIYERAGAVGGKGVGGR